MDQMTDTNKRVLSAFSKSGYTLRTATGLSKDSGMSKEEVQRALSELISKGLVNQLVNDKGVRFYLTVDGRKAEVALHPKAS